MTGKLRHQARSLCLTLMVGADGEMVVDRKESEGEGELVGGDSVSSAWGNGVLPSSEACAWVGAACRCGPSAVDSWSWPVQAVEVGAGTSAAADVVADHWEGQPGMPRARCSLQAL